MVTRRDDPCVICAHPGPAYRVTSFIASAAHQGEFDISTKATGIGGSTSTVGGRWARDPLRDAFLIAGPTYVALIALGLVGGGPDGIAYWQNRLPQPYAEGGYGGEAAFYYSPAFAQVIAPFTALPWPVFHALLIAANLGALWWMLGRWSAVALLFPPVAIELYSANINLLIAAAIVIGFRRPAAWAFPILTKVAPGIGVLWFAIRREWRGFAVSVGGTALIMAGSFVLAPDLWRQWIGLLTSSAGQAAPDLAIDIPLVVRLPVAIALLAWGALTDRRWVVPIAAALAMPILWPAQLSLLVACVPLTLSRRAGPLPVERAPR